jgi:hypothetical protein
MVARVAPSLHPQAGSRRDNIPPEGNLVNPKAGCGEVTVQRVRYLIVLLTGFLAGSRTVDAVQTWKDWRTRLATDPSDAANYHSYFLVDLAVAALSLIIAALVWWLLRPKTEGSSGRGFPQSGR